MGRAVTDGWLLATILRDPSASAGFDADRWTALIAVARAEQMIGTLASRMAGLPMPDTAARLFADARASAEEGRRAALWEAEMARRALAAIGVSAVLLKGTAFVAAGLRAGVGRAIGDLDILVARDRIDAVEAALLAAGWEWVKDDAYDHDYYRRWMHELPPLIHRDRDRMIDVHHTILPLTARITPDAAALLADGVDLGNGLRILSPADMVCHAAAHLIADGDLAGGMRNLWDIDCLCREVADADPSFFGQLYERSRKHGLTAAVARALRLAMLLYGTPVAEASGLFALAPRASDRAFVRRLTARDGWGRATRPVTRFAFYVRSHWLRMPPAMLARHLWTKWRTR